MVDADENPHERWNRIRSVLMDSGYSGVGEQIDLGGGIFKQENAPDVGVWIMPNNDSTGMLETFVSELVPHDDTLWARARKCVHDIPLNERRFSSGKTVKAEIHTWLAWQDEPGTPLGFAITKHYLNHDVDCARSFVAWVRRLFQL